MYDHNTEEFNFASTNSGYSQNDHDEEMLDNYSTEFHIDDDLSSISVSYTHLTLPTTSRV